MLELLNSGLVSIWLSMAGVPESLTSSVTVLQDTPWLVIPGESDPIAQATLQQYLNGLSAKGLSVDTQGIWLQSGPTLLASNQGNTPLPAASLTKVATTLISLDAWGPDHRFETLVSATGPIQRGVLQGDLVIKGGGDPLLVWEEAFAIANTLNQLGITKVTGNLIVTGYLPMNFEVDPIKTGELLKQAFDSTLWSEDAEYQFQQLPPGTPRPRLAIAGTVQVIPSESFVPANQTLLVRHYSLPMAHVLKLMNVHSNNVVSESLAAMAGGTQVVAQKAAVLSGVPSEEILLKNGSGLGLENRISPRAVCAMYAAIQRYVQPHNLTIADLFPISGVDKGTIDYRNIPAAAVVKTGTLNDVSALAGVVPTRDRGLVWFTIINRGTNLDDLRAQQDVLLQQLVSKWGTVKSTPYAITSYRPIQTEPVVLGAAERNEILLKPAIEVQTTQ